MPRLNGSGTSLTSNRDGFYGAFDRNGDGLDFLKLTKARADELLALAGIETQSAGKSSVAGDYGYPEA
jgi:hypothetical protein